MNCTDVQSNIMPYLYGELSVEQENELRIHFENCDVCTEQLEKMVEVQTFVGQSNPEIWNKNLNWGSYAKIAAVFILGIAIGWAVATPQGVPSKHQEFTQDELISVLVQNQEYRDSLTHTQLVLLQQMELRLAKIVNETKQVQYLHQLEHPSLDFLARIELQKDFLRRYPKSPLAMSVQKKLVQSLEKANKYQEAIVLYNKFLQNSELVPIQRGEYLWKLANCYQKTQNWKKSNRILEELERGDVYGFFRWKAIKTLGDYEFKNLNFLAAQIKYEQYQHNSQEKSELIAQRLHWMKHHQKDNYYPLTLFVQAQQQGINAYYGLNIIISEYPDSPLAFPAFEMYLRNQEIQNFQRLPAIFPVQKKPSVLLPYLEQVGNNEQFREIAEFAKYWRGRIIQQEVQDYQEALKIYQDVAAENRGKPLEIIANDKIIEVQKLIYK